MGKYDNIMADEGAYLHGLNPYHSGPDYTESEIEEILSGTSSSGIERIVMR